MDFFPCAKVTKKMKICVAVLGTLKGKIAFKYFPKVFVLFL